MNVRELEASPGEMAHAATINVRDLTKKFETDEGTDLVFNNISFAVESGSFVSLVGRSGSGKSTILNIISGVETPTEGEITFSVDDDEYRREAEEVTIGYVFQSSRLLPWNTCIENIEYVHGSNPEYSDDLAKKYLDMVDLSDHYDKYPAQLSGGQKQRVGIARAFSIDPDVLLMDEPFSNLDEITAHGLREELMSMWQQLRKTVLFVTHDITEAILLSDRLLMLGGGEIYGNVEVPLERPRDIDSEEFIQFRNEVVKKFHSIEDNED